jgi:Concanavalin A-like lectin/glucanases superfamily
MSCGCGIAIFTYTGSGSVVVAGGALYTFNPINLKGSGGCLAGSCAAVSTNKLWEGYFGVFHLKEAGKGTANEYHNSTHLQGGTALFPPNNPLQNQSNLWNEDQLFSGQQAITIPMDTLANGCSQNYSVSFWFKPTGLYATRTIFSRGTQLNSDNGFGCSIQIGYKMTLTMFANVQVIGADGWLTYNLLGTTTLTAGCWYHIALVFTSGSNATLYLDGNEEATIAISQTQLVPSDTIINLGRYNQAQNLAGELQEVRYLGSALSTTWIETEYLNFCNGFVSYGSEQSG